MDSTWVQFGEKGEGEPKDAIKPRREATLILEENFSEGVL